MLALCLCLIFLGAAETSSAAQPCTLERLHERAINARDRVNRIMLRAAVQNLPPARRCGITFTAALMSNLEAPVSLEDEAYRQALVTSLYGAAGFLKSAGRDRTARAVLVRLGELMRAYAASGNPETRRDHLLDILVTAKALTGLGARVEADALIGYAENIIRERLGAKPNSMAIYLLVRLQVAMGDRAEACALLSTAFQARAGGQGAAGNLNVPALVVQAVDAHKASCRLLFDRIMRQVGRGVEKAEDEAGHRQLEFLVIRAQLYIGRRRTTASLRATGARSAFWRCLDAPTERCLSKLWPDLRSWDDSDLAGYSFLGAMLRYADAIDNEPGAGRIANHLIARLSAVSDPRRRLRFLIAALILLVQDATDPVKELAAGIAASVQFDERDAFAGLEFNEAVGAIIVLASLPGGGGLGFALLNGILPERELGPLDISTAAALARVIDSLTGARDASLRRQGLALIGARLAAAGVRPINATAGLLLVEALTRADLFDVAGPLLDRINETGMPGRASSDAAFEVARAFVAELETIEMPDGFVASMVIPLLLSGLWQPDGQIGPTLPFDAAARAGLRP